MLDDFAVLDWTLSRALFTACDHFSDGVVIIDEHRLVRYMNLAASGLVGAVQVEGRRSQPCRTIMRCGPVQQPNSECGHCRVSTTLRGRVAMPFFDTAVGPPGARVPVHASCSPVPGEHPAAVLLLRPAIGLPVAPPDAPEQPDLLPAPGQAVLQSLVHAARELLGADYAALGRVDVDASEVAWVVQEGNCSADTARARVPLGQGIRGRVVSSGQSVFISSFPQGAPDPPELHPTMQTEQLKAALAVPVYIHGESAGVLMVARREQGGYLPHHEHSLRVMARLAGEAMANGDWFLDVQAAAVRAEREWLAAELHDGLAQVLGAMVQKLKLVRWAIRRSDSVGQSAPGLEEVLSLSEQAHQELRLALTELRMPATQQDFLGALESTLADFRRRFGLRASLAEVPDLRPPFSAPVALQVLRVIQEALTNARKHSGGTGVSVRWSFAANRHTFTITDDGHGFTPEQAGQGFGLNIMAERASRIGGSLTVVSRPRGGCSVMLTVPHRTPEGSRKGEASTSALG